MVTTGKAKQAIKNYLKRERQNNIERGQQLLEERLQALNIQLAGHVLRKIIPAYGCSTKEELYSKIGAGIITLDDLEKIAKSNSGRKLLKFWTFFIPQKNEEENQEQEKQGSQQQPTQEPSDHFEIAECCHPIPGDKVVGYRDPLSGKIIVHKASCDELNRLAAQHGKNIVKEEIQWSRQKAMSYLATVELRGIDRKGILMEMARIISGDFNINMREINIKSHAGIFEGSLSLYVKDVESLTALMDKIRQIKGIESVKRIL